MSRFCSDFDTTEDWQRNETGIVVMALGATEQHGHHLPLNTDTLSAQYFAEFVAKELGAMLMPAMPFGTSLEHAGFRGTISLKPEVLISFVQNIVDELESQNVKIFIIMNGHGGNFVLGPVVRQINRADRKIKVLLINCWEFGSIQTVEPEIHAGESETSLMLCLHKDLVQLHKHISANPALQEECYKQSDLNTFGIGRMNVAGVWGNPKYATVAKGKRRVLQTQKNLLPFIRERMQRIERDSRYAGVGPFIYRPMITADISVGMKLKNIANWNQTAKDWEMILSTSKGGNYVALKNGEVVGTVTTVSYSNHFSWVGMVLVDPNIRRSGIGKTLLNQAIEYAKTKGAVCLDATPAGKKLYDTLGFQDEFLLTRMQTYQPLTSTCVATLDCQKIQKRHLKKIFEKDVHIFGAGRKEILMHLWQNKPSLAFVCELKGRVVGYCFGREGQNFTQIGPLIADSLEIAQSLVLSALQNDNGQNYIVDTLDSQTKWNQFLGEIGFEAQRPFIRMVLGKELYKCQTTQQYLIAGPELG